MDWEDRAVGSAAGAALGARRVITVKRRLREATIPGLAEGEQILVATYGRSGSPVFLLCEFGAIAIFIVALFASFPPLIYASGGAVLVFAVVAAITWSWPGLVLTDRRLILSRAAPISQRLKGILLEVTRSQVAVQRFSQGRWWVTLVLRFDDAVGRAPIRLTFQGFQYPADGRALHGALAAPKLGA